MKKLVIVGCGRLAEIVANAVVKGLLPDYDLVGVYSRTASKAAHIVHKMQQHGKRLHCLRHIGRVISIKTRLSGGIGLSCRYAGIGFASIEKRNLCHYLVYRCFGRRDILSESGRNSQGKWYTNLYRIRSYRWIRCFKNCLSDGKYDGRFFNEKGPNGLKGTPVYDDSLQTEQRTVFSGSAAEAIRLFPTKVNVTVAASRASVGPENMQVSIQSTPGFVGDTQRVEIKNDQVHAVVDIYSATSEIAGWSVVSTLINIASPIVF
jgi:aspartate dehydrogenase